MDSVWEIYSDTEKLCCKFHKQVSRRQSEEQTTFLTYKINDISTQNHQMMFFSHCDFIMSF